MRAAVATSSLGWWIAAGAALTLAVVFALWSRRPRLAFDGRNLLLYIRNGLAIRVPVSYTHLTLPTNREV